MWEITVADQTVTFIYSLVLGAVLCLFYDLFRSVRKIRRFGFFGVFFQDVLFWVVSALTVFCFLLVTTDGLIRGYVLLGALLGFIITRFSLSVIFTFALCKIFSITVRLLRALKAAFAHLFVRLNHFFCKIITKMKKTGKKILFLLKKLLKRSG